MIFNIELDDTEHIPAEINVLLEQFGPDGTCYEDSHVVDLLQQDVDQDELLPLLRQIEQDWEIDQEKGSQRGM